jgi:flagellar motor switch protein FliG
MPAQNIRKAAMFLMNLPPATAAELLKSAPLETVTQIAAEVAYLRNAGLPKDGQQDPFLEFATMLSNRRGPATGNDFVRQLLEAVLGKARLEEAMRQVQQLSDDRDPFLAVRSANPQALAAALAGESAGVVAMVLAELTPRTSAKLLPLLEASVHDDVVCGMAGAAEVSEEARFKVATVIRKRLKEMSSKTTVTALPDYRQHRLRKLALVLRGLDKALRDKMVQSIEQQDKETAATVLNLMVTWQDVTIVPDRTLQEVLRLVDTRKLALALIKTDGAVTKKIRGNISERAAAMVDEEISLLSKPKNEDIGAAREQILDALRQLNAKGELALEEGSGDGA